MESSELTELLERLNISPVLLYDEDVIRQDQISSRSSSETPSIADADDLDGCHKSQVSNDDLDRESLMEQLLATKDDEIVTKWKNDYFHEYLVEHYKRKQMMHVYGDEPENEATSRKYLRKLAELEKLKQEIQASREDQEIEVTALQKKLASKIDEATKAIDCLVSREREVGAAAYTGGKSLSLKKIETSIAQQLGKIEEISKFRVRHVHLRDDFIAKQTTLNTLNVLNPSLTKDDYACLEAEKFYYAHDLVNKEEQCQALIRKKNRLARQMDVIRKKGRRTKREIVSCKKLLKSQRDTFDGILREKRLLTIKARTFKRFVWKFDESAGLRTHPDLFARMETLRREHEEWLRRISRLVTKMKAQKQSLNALRANLMLHGKSLNKREGSGGDKCIAVSDSGDDTDDKGSVCAIKRSNLPPLGGGFYQAMRSALSP